MVTEWTGTPTSSDLEPDRPVDLTAWRNWNLHNDVAWDPTLNRPEPPVTLQYLASSGQVANLGYRFEQGQLEQADVSTAWPIGGHWELMRARVYSLRDHESTENFVGSQYHGRCWGVRLVAQRRSARARGARHRGVRCSWNSTASPMSEAE